MRASYDSTKSSGPPRAMTRQATPVLARRCACGGGCAQCASEREDSVLHRRSNVPGPAYAPPVVHDVLQSPGRPLDRDVRRSMETAFGQDFSRVRVHTDDRAAASAEAVSASAYTVGQHIVFGRGQFTPGSGASRELLAHELAHSVQQRDARPGGRIAVGAVGTHLEHEADAAADAAMGRAPATGTAGRSGTEAVMQRRVTVRQADVPLPGGQPGPPDQFTNTVQNLLHDICPTGGFRVDARTGVVSGRDAFCEWHPPLVRGVTEADISPTPAGCGCLCQAVNSAQTTTIEFHPGPPGTGHGTGQWGGPPSGATVSADPRFQGQYRINGRWVDIPFHLIFGHELCGHALPRMQGTDVPDGPPVPGGTPTHERQAVDVERRMAAEHSPPLPRRPEDYSGAARERP